MKILLKVHRSPVKCLLVELTDKATAHKVKTLIDKGKYSKAIASALSSKGRVIKEVPEHTVRHLPLVAVLTEKNSHRDLT